MVISDTSLSYLDLFQLVLPNHSNPRRLLLHRQPKAQPPVPTPSSGTKTQESNFDANVIMILAVLLCALICALGLNSIVRCALQCSSRMAFHYFPDGERCVVGGVKKKALKSMPTLTYSDGMVLPVSGPDCAICLSEFGAGEKVRVLPKCNHGFHVACIDRWLSSHSSCPTCRRCLFTNSCKKESRCGVEEAAPPPRSVVLSPLDPEAPSYNYRGPY